MNKNVKLNAREVDELHKLFHKLSDRGEYSQVELEESGDNGIGTFLTATFDIEHEGVQGKFTVHLTDESHW